MNLQEQLGTGGSRSVVFIISIPTNVVSMSELDVCPELCPYSLESHKGTCDLFIGLWNKQPLVGQSRCRSNEHVKTVRPQRLKLSKPMGRSVVYGIQTPCMFCGIRIDVSQGESYSHIRTVSARTD